MALQLRFSFEKVEVELAKVKHINVIELGRERGKVPRFNLELSQLNPVHVLDLCTFLMLSVCIFRKEKEKRREKK